MRLVRDFPENALRVTAGDIFYASDGFQSTRSAAGITLARNFALQPYRSVRPAGDTQFDIERTSRVEVFVNGQRVQTLRLAPGRYNIRNFPFASGPNDVAIRITDEVGRTETIRFPFIFDATLLGAGEQEFSHAIGVPSESTPTGRDYDTGGYVFSGFHNIGITDALTAGANVQLSDEQRQFGANVRFATRIGTFRTDIAVSHADTASTDFAVRTQYRYTDDLASSAGRTLSASAIYRGRDFATIETTAEPSNPVALDLAVSYGQRLFWDTSGSIGYGRQFGRGDTPDLDTYSLTLIQQITSEISLSFVESHRAGAEGNDDTRFFAGVSYAPFGSPHRFAASLDTGTRSSRINWSYAPSYTLGDVQADATLERTPADYTLSGSARYTHYRFEGTVQHDENLPRDGDLERIALTSLRFGTALAFADGHVAASRPINDSSVLIAPHPRLRDYRINVNPREDEEADARTDWLGPAVLPSLTSYYVHQVVLDAPDLPIGFELGDQIYGVEPTYRSGTVIRAGTGGTVLLDGYLLDAAGKPLGLHVGTFTAVDEPDRPPIKFFTNRAGRFRVLGLSPGRYELWVEVFSDRFYRFELPEDAAGLYNIGRIEFPTE